ncbi:MULTISPECIES: phosphonate C-P lyase system protein PhnH [Desulfobacula]|uniref:PhnH: phopsphonate metabolism protein, predicted C-P lyase subunit n=2 Tax=Desulfobacula TaxID=28222 RepID=K0NMV5_DESTT|nr:MULTISPECIES: phosphonate C-P lyase system protein PhnH [Desulfobacula]CCK81348.1 PhnH: phopsphonate metabolism protein, predicted C-P lyase subunit [Desulfobacula toluolica Tol2]SDU25919.1 alpha-D-ribose 1-methylphosphonate 5-triphosphate synthase subunit PhnH [Desulfobacula phenolica]
MLKGFQSETYDTQYVFRELLSAMAKPGIIKDMELDMACPGNLHMASGAILLALLDFETPLCSDLKNTDQAIQWIRFHTGAPIIRMPNRSLFALYTNLEQLKDPAEFNQGTIESPDQSTTLLIQTSGLENNGRIKLTGPGIQCKTYLNLKGVKDIFLHKRADMINNYPLGIDMIFIYNNRFVAIPRTTKLEIF